MFDLDLHISKFGNSAIRHMGHKVSFEQILTQIDLEVLRNRVTLFKSRLGLLNLDSLASVRNSWRQYEDYISFVEKFIDRQVNWFETRL